MFKSGKQLLILFICIYCLVGSFSLIFLRLQNLEVALNVSFKHPWFQSFILFIGFSLCLLLYYIIKCCNPKFNTTHEHDSEGTLKVPPHIFFYFAPAFIEFFGILFGTFAILNLSISTLAMLKGANVFFKIMIAKVFYGARFHRNQILGIILVIIGFSGIGISHVYFKEFKESGDRNMLFGYVSLLLNAILTSFKYYLEEKIMLNYKAHSLQVAGWQGIFGLILSSLFLVLFEYVDCPVGILRRHEICTVDNTGHHFFENTTFALQQIGSNTNLLLFVIGYMICVCLDNALGITISKIGSQGKRAIADTFRPIPVWLFFVTVPTKNNENFILLEAISYLVLALGIFFFFEILDVSMCKLNKAKPKDLTLSQGGIQSVMNRNTRLDFMENMLEEMGEINNGYDNKKVEKEIESFRKRNTVGINDPDFVD